MWWDFQLLCHQTLKVLSRPPCVLLCKFFKRCGDIRHRHISLKEHIPVTTWAFALAVVIPQELATATKAGLPVIISLTVLCRKVAVWFWVHKSSSVKLILIISQVSLNTSNSRLMDQFCAEQVLAARHCMLQDWEGHKGSLSGLIGLAWLWNVWVWGIVCESEED